MPGGISMSIMTIRLSDDKHKRLKQLAQSQHISLNKLIEDLDLIGKMLNSYIKSIGTSNSDPKS